MSRVELDKQVGGNHYEKMAIQPIEYILANKLGFVEGSVVKYVSRWEDKGGVEDLKKARQLLDMKISDLEAEPVEPVEPLSLSELVDFLNASLPDANKASLIEINSNTEVVIKNTDMSIKRATLAYHCYDEDKEIEERIIFTPRLILEWILSKIRSEADEDSEVVINPEEVRNLYVRDSLYDLIYEDDDIIPDVYKITNKNRISIPSQDITIECVAGERYDHYPNYYCKKRNDPVSNFFKSDLVLEWIKENIN